MPEMWLLSKVFKEPNEQTIDVKLNKTIKTRFLVEFKKANIYQSPNSMVCHQIFNLTITNTNNLLITKSKEISPN